MANIEDSPKRISPAEFGKKLAAMLDPQTPQEWADFLASSERVRENEAKLRRKLPPLGSHDLPLGVKVEIPQER